MDNLSDAINVLIQGVRVAQKRGAYEFGESADIGVAVNFLNKLSSELEQQQAQQSKQQQQAQAPVSSMNNFVETDNDGVQEASSGEEDYPDHS